MTCERCYRENCPTLTADAQAPHGDDECELCDALDDCRAATLEHWRSRALAAESERDDAKALALRLGVESGDALVVASENGARAIRASGERDVMAEHLEAALVREEKIAAALRTAGINFNGTVPQLAARVADAVCVARSAMAGMNAQLAEAERKLALATQILDMMDCAITGHELTDFELSFPQVRAARDLYLERDEAETRYQDLGARIGEMRLSPPPAVTAAAEEVLRLAGEATEGPLIWWMSERAPFPICTVSDVTKAIATAERIGDAEWFCRARTLAVVLAEWVDRARRGAP